LIFIALCFHFSALVSSLFSGSSGFISSLCQLALY
jgi:hypothetical protein